MVIVVVTVSLAVAMTDTVPAALFITYSWDPSGVSSSPSGPLPTGMVAISAPVLALIAYTSLPLCAEAYRVDPSGDTTMPNRSSLGVLIAFLAVLPVAGWYSSIPPRLGMYSTDPSGLIAASP